MDRIRAHPVLLGMAIWLVIASAATAAIWALDARDREIGANGVNAMATVSGTHPANHNAVDYSYVVDGKTYQQSGPGDGPEGGAAQLRAGEAIQIVYDPQEPSVSCYCDRPSLRKEGDWWRTAIAGVFLASVLSIVLTVMVLRLRGNIRGPGSTADPR